MLPEGNGLGPLVDMEGKKLNAQQRADVQAACVEHVDNLLWDKPARTTYKNHDQLPKELILKALCDEFDFLRLGHKGRVAKRVLQNDLFGGGGRDQRIQEAARKRREAERGRELTEEVSDPVRS